MKKIALITGITGQDGYYLTKFLFKKNYIVHGIKRRSSTVKNIRLDEIFEKEKNKKKQRFFLHYGDMTDGLNLNYLIKKIQPDEIYNLAAQSHVQVSFELPEYTSNADGLGVLRILEIIKESKKKIKFYQASTSEMFGGSLPPQNENTKFEPKSPYGIAKLYAYWMVRCYRDSYKIHASNGILFNHESPLRGESFVTRKVSLFVANYFKSKSGVLKIGNLDAIRDWGHAKDYVIAMWKIMQQKKPDDFVIGTQTSFTVRNFIEEAFKIINIKIIWKGKGINETGLDSNNNKKIIIVDKKYFRPNEVNYLIANITKAKKLLNWKPKISYKKLVKEMVLSDIKEIKKIKK
jgi:GDPmannose 4,6-dehydratase